MEADPVLPNLFVIGAAKCGTTSLHHYLGLHPEVSMSSVKEPRLFVEDGYPESLRHCSDLFEAGAAVRGESTAVYSQYPGWPGVAERIADHAPDARIVYLVRDPIERALAHYRQHVRNGTESRPAEAALADPKEPDHTYLTASRYGTQIGRYGALFSPEQILIIDQRSLRESRGATLAQIFAHLGVDPSFSSVEFRVELNTRESLRRPTPVGSGLQRSGLLSAARRLPGAERLRTWARGMTSRQVAEPDLSADLRRSLESELAPEADAIRRFSGLSLGHWSV